jgi:hypothetical protein
LALDFPIRGPTKISLSLDPKLAKSAIAQSNLISIFKERIKGRLNQDELASALLAFFETTSEFVAARSVGHYPESFNATLENDHFVLWRQSPQFKFEINNYAFNQKFFERTELKLYSIRDNSTSPVMTLFLVPTNCSL